VRRSKKTSERARSSWIKEKEKAERPGMQRICSLVNYKMVLCLFAALYSGPLIRSSKKIRNFMKKSGLKSPGQNKEKFFIGFSTYRGGAPTLSHKLLIIFLTLLWRIFGKIGVSAICSKNMLKISRKKATNHARSANSTGLIATRRTRKPLQAPLSVHLLKDL
jgi:hypothetical protein